MCPAPRHGAHAAVAVKGPFSSSGQTKDWLFLRAKPTPLTKPEAETSRYREISPIHTIPTTLYRMIHFKDTRVNNYISRNSSPPCSVSHDISSPARTLRLWVRIPFEAWMYVWVIFCVGSWGGVKLNSLVRRPLFGLLYQHRMIHDDISVEQ
jgi:hypothetical protein